MDLTCRRRTFVLPLIALGLLFAVGVASSDQYLYARCIIEPLGYPGMNISGEILIKQSLSRNVTELNGHLVGFSNGTQGNHGFHVHENGSLAKNCTAAGLHYNPLNKTHGGLNDTNRHVGDLGNIVVEANLASHITISDTVISLQGDYSIVNRALVVHAGEDDLGKGGYNDSLTTGHSGYRIGCCIITLDPVTVPPSTSATTKSGPTGTATSMGPCGFLLLFMAGLLLSVKCIQL